MFGAFGVGPLELLILVVGAGCLGVVVIGGVILLVLTRKGDPHGPRDE
jgi:hypothetical protein